MILMKTGLWFFFLLPPNLQGKAGDARGWKLVLNFSLSPFLISKKTTSYSLYASLCCLPSLFMHMWVCFHFIIFITAAFFHLYTSHPLKFNYRNSWLYLHVKIYISVADWWSFSVFNRLISLPAALCQKALFIITGKNLEWVTHKERKWPLDLPNSRLAPPTSFTQKPKAVSSGADLVHSITVAAIITSDFFKTDSVHV